jgi:hypothetical protein
LAPLTLDGGAAGPILDGIALRDPATTTTRKAT